MYVNQREALAYIAGLIDGEGSLIIRRNLGTMQMLNRKYPNYHPEIHMGMIHREPLDFVQSVTGLGKVYEEKPYHHKRPMFRFKITRKEQIRMFIDLIYEFLIVKKKNADVVREFFATCLNGPGIPISEELNSKRYALWIKNRTLNGVVEVPAETERKNKGGRSKGV